MDAVLKVARDDSGRAYGTHVVLRAYYTDLASRLVKLTTVEVVEFRGHMHKTRARDYAASVSNAAPRIALY